MNKIEPIVVNDSADDNNNSMQIASKIPLANGCVDASLTLSSHIADDNSEVIKNGVIVGSQNGYALCCDADSGNTLDACTFLDAKIECSVTILSTSNLGNKHSNSNDFLSQLQPTTKRSFTHACVYKDKDSELKKLLNTLQ